MKRLSVKKAPNMMKTTKYMYIFRLISYFGWSSCYKSERKWRHQNVTVIMLKSSALVDLMAAVVTSTQHLTEKLATSSSNNSLGLLLLGLLCPCKN